MDKFLIRTNETKDIDYKLTNKIRDFLEKQGKCVFVEGINPDTYDKEFGHECKEAYDLAIVLGGDGTVLRAARDFVNADVPILGVNLGTVGYLTEISEETVIDALTKIMAGQYETDDRMMLEGSYIKNGENKGHAIALNDIAVCKETPYSAIYFEIYVNDRFLTEYGADGIIVSTPTGSTGYNLSAGGPIVEPGADLFVMTPVSPHTINSRSIILSPEDKVTIKLLPGKNGSVQKAVAMADSANRFNMESGDMFELRRSRKSVKFVKLSKTNFLEVLRNKLK